MIYPIVSIVFPNYNGGKEPLDCLSSIQKLNYPKDKIETIVVDNASSDGSVREIKEMFPDTIIVELKTNYGFAKAINTGIKHAKGKYVFVGNDDIVFHKKSIHEMVSFMEKDIDVGIVGGKIFFKNNKHKICSSGQMMNKWTGNIYNAKDPEKIKEPDWVQGCAMFIRKKMLKEIGLLDEGFKLVYFEDFDLCLRSKRAGFRVVYLPLAILYHGEGITLNKNMENKYFQWYKNKLRFILKNLPLSNIISVLLLQIFFIMPFRFFILRDGRCAPFTKGLLWNMKNISKTLTARSLE